MNPDKYPEDLPPEDRRKCVFDELVFGASYIEETADGPRRVDPVEVTRLHE